MYSMQDNNKYPSHSSSPVLHSKQRMYYGLGEHFLSL